MRPETDGACAGHPELDGVDSCHQCRCRVQRAAPLHMIYKAYSIEACDDPNHYAAAARAMQMALDAGCARRA